MLATSLNGQGVPSVGEALLDMQLTPLHSAIREALSPERLRSLKSGWKDGHVTSGVLASLDHSIRSVAQATAEVEHKPLKSVDVTLKARKEFISLQQLIQSAEQGSKKEIWQEFILKKFPNHDEERLDGWRTILSWIVVSHVSESIFEENDWQDDLFDRWRLAKPLIYSFVRSGIDEGQANREFRLLKALERFHEPHGAELVSMVAFAMVDPHVREFLMVNRWDNVLWFNKERFEEILGWIFIVSAIQTFESNDLSITDAREKTGVQFESFNSILENAEQSKYQVETFLERIAARHADDPIVSPRA